MNGIGRYINYDGNNNGRNSYCSCFRGTCEFCAPSIMKGTYYKNSTSETKQRKGETTDE